MGGNSKTSMKRPSELTKAEWEDLKTLTIPVADNRFRPLSDREFALRVSQAVETKRKQARTARHTRSQNIERINNALGELGEAIIAANIAWENHAAADMDGEAYPTYTPAEASEEDWNQYLTGGSTGQSTGTTIAEFYNKGKESR